MKTKDEEDQDKEDQGREDQNQAEDEDQEEDPANEEDDNSDQQQDDQEDNQMDTNDSGHSSLQLTPDTRKFKVFGNHTACELNKKNFELSICKILPDTAEFPEDIFNIEGCIWCGSKGHDVYNCLGYATWLGDLWLAPLEERRLTYPQRQKKDRRNAEE